MASNSSADEEPMESQFFLGEPYFLLGDSRQSGATWLAVSIAMFLLATVGFVFAIFNRPGQFQLHLMTTMPVLVALGCLAKARAGFTSPLAIGFTPNGLRVWRPRHAVFHSWEQISWVSVDDMPITSTKRLTVFDRQGKKLLVLADTFPDFGELATLLRERAREEVNSAARGIRLRKAKRTAIQTAAIGAGLLLVCLANIWMSYAKQHEELLLMTEAVPGEGKILRHFVAPNGVTKRLEYEVTDTTGERATRNAEVEPTVWELLEDSDIVPVVYVPGRPDLSRLSVGEVEDRDFSTRPGVMYALSAVMILFCLLCFAGAIVQWRGNEIYVDKGRISIRPFGDGKVDSMKS